MDDYIEAYINIFENDKHHVKIRKSISIGTLIQEILNEFSELDFNEISNYAIYREKEIYPIFGDEIIENLNLQAQETLNFRWLRPVERKPISGEKWAILRNEKNRKQTFRLLWQPALIGRTTPISFLNKLFVINVENMLEGKSVARQHAQIIQKDNQFFIESLDRDNPTYVNDKQVYQNEQIILNHGDKIILGHSNLTFTFILRHPQSIQLMARAILKIRKKFEKARASLNNRWQKNIIAYLQVLIASPHLEGKTIEIYKAKTTLGHDPNFSDVQLYFPDEESSVSKKHCTILYDKSSERFSIKDHNSTHGTFINDVLLDSDKPMALADDDEIVLGDKFRKGAKLRFSITNEIISKKNKGKNISDFGSDEISFLNELELGEETFSSWLDDLGSKGKK